jgi:capsular polysaccharide transport system permease protein
MSESVNYHRIGDWPRRHIVFVLTVLAPTLLAGLYYGLIASDVYISESRFVVRSPEHQKQTGIVSELLQGTGFTRAQDDTYSVRDFILSRDALKELNDRLGVRKLFADPNIDIVDRFPGLRWDGSFERFYLYYGKHVEADYDPVTSITTLTTRAFTADDAYNINRLLIDMSERLVNALNERSRNDLIRFAEDDVRVAADKAHQASLAMLAFRSKESVFEPAQQATLQLEGVAKIQEELITTEAELAQLKKLSPSNPQIGGLVSRGDILRKAIASEAAKVTNADGSLSARAPTFERLALDSTAADEQLGAALGALQTARSEAARQALYLERLVHPNRPDRAMEPRRIRSVFTVFIVGLIGWGVLSLVLASIREHAA